MIDIKINIVKLEQQLRITIKCTVQQLPPEHFKSQQTEHAVIKNRLKVYKCFPNTRTTITNIFSKPRTVYTQRLNKYSRRNYEHNQSYKNKKAIYSYYKY
jgi:hypothetical protein